MKIQNFVLIIGAAKCGTTSLYNYLSEHPQICSCHKKEPHFFSKDENFNRGSTYYQSLFDWNDSTHKYALEATPGYTRVTNESFVNAAQNIAQFKLNTNTSFKFIYIVRDPIKRIESHYTHLKAWKQEPNKKPIKDGLDKEIIEVSKYGMQIEEYYQRFNSHDILILNFQDLKNNSLEVTKKVCNFLNINPNYSFQGLNKVHNANSKRTTINIPLWSTLRRQSIVYSLIRILPLAIKLKLRRLLGTKITDFVELSPEQKKTVLKELEADFAKQKKYGIDVSSWII